MLGDHKQYQERQVPTLPWLARSPFAIHHDAFLSIQIQTDRQTVRNPSDTLQTPTATGGGKNIRRERKLGREETDRPRESFPPTYLRASHTEQRGMEEESEESGERRFGTFQYTQTDQSARIHKQTSFLVLAAANRAATHERRTEGGTVLTCL